MAKKKYAINPKEVEPEYQELAARMNFDGSKYLPRIIKKALTLEQANVAIELYTSPEEIASTLGISEEGVASDSQRYQVEAIAKKLNLDREMVENHIRYMFELGFAFPTRRGWRFARTYLQMKDSMTNTKYDDKLGDEFFDLWEAFQKIEGYPTFLPFMFELMEKTEPGMRLVPARKSLKNISNIAAGDSFEEILRLSSVVAVEHCPCKRLVRDRTCHSPTEVCIICDRLAEHNLRRGAARVISVEEAVAIHDMATEFGMLCMGQGTGAQPTMICHCHWCCCDYIAPAIMMNFSLAKRINPSCYQAVVDPEKCTGCQICLTRCQFGAIQMKRYPREGRQERLKAWVDPEKCVGCGLCVIKCPAEARSMKQVKEGMRAKAEQVATSGTYTRQPGYKEGKHLETGSVMTRPLY